MEIEDGASKGGKVDCHTDHTVQVTQEHNINWSNQNKCQEFKGQHWKKYSHTFRSRHEPEIL